jgi:iron(III) transport system substrate-binding protein
MACMLAGGCRPPAGEEVVVYTALDGEFSQPVLDAFGRQTGVEVRAKLDAESTKTVGLAQELLAEARRPRCDVFWNNEILNTIRLQKRGLLAPYAAAGAENFPAQFRSPQGYWYGFAARARVLAVNTRLVPDGQRPGSIEDLAAARWRGKTGLAKPLFGSTATHAACLFAYWGPERAKDFFARLKANGVQVLSGNKQVALAVAAGQLAFGLTDTDDAIIEQEKGMPIAIVYPDQGEGGIGTLFIPNTVAVIAGGPHPQAARRLVDYLLSPGVEAALAAGASAQIPLSSAVPGPVRVATPRTVKAMRVDFDSAAAQWDATAEFLRDQFTGG